MSRLPATLDVSAHLRIPAQEVELTYARSGGPGGQHVNKTSSKVLLRWNVNTSAAPREPDRVRLLERLASRLTQEGDLLVTSERHREQSRNVDDAVAKFIEVLRAALRRPRARRATKPTKASQRRRLEGKRRRSEAKRGRRRPTSED